MDSEKTKRIYIIILIIALFASLAVIFYFLIYPNFLKEKIVENGVVPEQTSLEIKNEKRSSAITTQDSETLAKGSVLVDFENCQKNPMEYFKKEDASIGGHIATTALLAFAKKDQSVCSGSELGGEGSLLSKKCNNIFALMTAMAANGDCGKISDNDSSITCRANQGQDLSICAQLLDNDKKILCEAVVTGDNNKCKTILDNQRNDCNTKVILIKAFNTHDISLCDSISSDDVGYCRIALSQDPQQEWNDFYAKNICVKEYINRLAKEKNDISLCENIRGKDTDKVVQYNACLAQFK